MAHKKKHTDPIPAGNRAKNGAVNEGQIDEPTQIVAGLGAPAHEQDPARRLGNYETAGEHAIQQPDGKNGANT